MSKVHQSGGSQELAEAAAAASRHSQVMGAWDKNQGKTLVIQFADGRPPQMIAEPIELDFLALRGAKGFAFVTPQAKSDRKGGIQAGSVPEFESFARGGQALGQPNRPSMPKSLRHSQKLGGRPTTGGVATGAKTRTADHGPFPNANASREAQKLLTKLGYGAVTTLDGGWGPKSEKALLAFMANYGITDRKEAATLLPHVTKTAPLKNIDTIVHPELSTYESTRLLILKAHSRGIQASDKAASATALRDLAALDRLATECAGALVSADVPRATYSAYQALVTQYTAYETR